jgi:hypothetical protein
MPFRALVVSCLALLLVAGCGGNSGESAEPSSESIPTVVESLPGPKAVNVYFLRADKVGPVRREVTGPGVARATMRELLEGPTGPDRSAGLSTAISEGAKLEAITISDGVATVEVSGTLDAGAEAQIVYTLTQFDTVRRVSIDGHEPVGRGEMEDFTPSVLVESPLPGQSVHTPLRITGTANTFEATFNLELLDGEGKVLAERFVTATSGTGTRGTYDAELPFEITREGPGSLMVFELSAEDGSRIHELKIPLQITVFP